MENPVPEQGKVSIEIGNIVEVVVTAVERALRHCNKGGGKVPFGGDIVIGFRVGSDKSVEISQATSDKSS